MRKLKTIKDLAKIAGVSVGATSMVLNDKWHKKVKPDIAEKILQLAKKHNFVLNPLGRALQKNQFFRIAILMESTFTDHPLIGAFSFHDYIGIASDRLNSNGYSLDIIQLDEAKQKMIIENGLFPNNVDAFIFLQWEEDLLTKLLEKGSPRQPFIIIGNDLNNPDWSCLYRATKEMSRQSITGFIENGHDRIGIAKVSGSPLRFQQKLNGYKRALADAGIEFAPDLVLDLKLPKHSMASGVRLAEQYLALPNPPTAFFCDDNIDALGMLVHFQKEGFSIPEQIEIIGYGDDFLANLGTLPLSYLQIPNKEMAQLSVDHLLSVLNNKASIPSLRKEIQEKLILQHTTR